MKSPVADDRPVVIITELLRSQIFFKFLEMYVVPKALGSLPISGSKFYPEVDQSSNMQRRWLGLCIRAS